MAAACERYSYAPPNLFYLLFEDILARLKKNIISKDTLVLD